MTLEGAKALEERLSNCQVFYEKRHNSRLRSDLDPTAMGKVMIQYSLGYQLSFKFVILPLVGMSFTVFLSQKKLLRQSRLESESSFCS